MRESLNSLNKSDCLNECFNASNVCDFLLFCDASDVSNGGFIEHMSIDGQKNNVESVFAGWSENKSQKSSTWKELEAVNRNIPKCFYLKLYIEKKITAYFLKTYFI